MLLVYESYDVYLYLNLNRKKLGRVKRFRMNFQFREILDHLLHEMS